MFCSIAFNNVGYNEQTGVLKLPWDKVADVTTNKMGVEIHLNKDTADRIVDVMGRLSGTLCATRKCWKSGQLLVYKRPRDGQLIICRLGAYIPR